MFKKNNGFTLIELLVTVTVLGIILAIAVPSFDAMIRNYRLQSATSQLVDSINLARNTALSSNQVITIEASGTGTDQSWNNGWVISRGTEEVRVFEEVAGATVNATTTTTSTSGTSGTPSTTTTNITEIAFAGNGRLSAPNTGAAFTVTVGTENRTVNVNLSGQTRVR
ncbi:GspH/FimT family pseudopilin [Zooshikella marina]|uniref:GspH/FimT family pseudopilin n=1 Tax=Zooshikella ganghwensis TaxID=202772 RepID=UPI0004287E58|nr:GspH/FimT family pseudopilin [Zooshikella ganghwensis]MBU2707413.1 GspH/FimT family pseudopilin [Zooshikella ganghwensis]